MPSDDNPLAAVLSRMTNFRPGQFPPYFSGDMPFRFDQVQQLLAATLEHALSVQLVLLQAVIPTTDPQEALQQQASMFEHLRRALVGYQRELFQIAMGVAQGLPQPSAAAEGTGATSTPEAPSQRSQAAAATKPAAAMPMAPNEFLASWQRLVWDPMVQQVAQATATAAQTGAAQRQMVKDTGERIAEQVRNAAVPAPRQATARKGNGQAGAGKKQRSQRRSSRTASLH